MLLQNKFISTSELQQNVSKTIDKAKVNDVIVIRNNKLEAAIISIEKYNEFLEYVEWKNLSEKLDNILTEYVSEIEANEVMQLMEKARKEERYTIEDIEKLADSGVDTDEL